MPIGIGRPSRCNIPLAPAFPPSRHRFGSSWKYGALINLQKLFTLLLQMTVTFDQKKEEACAQEGEIQLIALVAKR